MPPSGSHQSQRQKRARPARSESSQRRPRRRRRRRGPRGQPQPGQSLGERPVSGLLELNAKGTGRLRPGALARADDPVLPAARVRELGLRLGDLVEGIARGHNMVTVSQVNGHEPEGLADRPRFDDLTAIHPDTPLVLGPTADAITGRLLDLIAPVGRGQRALIVAPPMAGKTTLLKELAAGLAADPALTLIACLIGERPEEVTELRRDFRGMVLAADLDQPAADHTRVASLGIAHAKRLVEEGRHAVVFVDSLTRLARAHNLTTRGGSRTLSGGIDAGALQPVRQVFGAARATEEAGSLTILATCLVDTGSRLDDLVYEEFKGTGNMEVYLDRSLAERRLFPAVDIARSGTRREELLLDEKTLEKVRRLRRHLAGAPAAEALSALLGALRRGMENQTDV